MKLGNYFSPVSPADLSDEAEGTRQAIAIVLAAAARSDSHLAVEEREAMLNMFECKLGLDRDQAAVLFNKEECLDKAIHELKAQLSLEQRELILGLTWAIIAADKVVEDEESAFASSLRSCLGLTMEQSLRSRKIAEGVTIDGFKEFVEAYQAAVSSRRPIEDLT